MKKCIIESTLLWVLLGIVGPIAGAASHVENAIDYRTSVMTVFKWHMGPMGAMVKGELPFDGAVFKSRADGLANATRQDVIEGFPEGSGEETDALPKIWQEWDDFESKYQALRDEAAELKRVADQGDQAAIKAQFAKTGKTCGGCHKQYRKEQK